MSDEMEIGRILGGSTKRSNIAQRVKEIAKTKGMKPSEVIEEAISVYEMVEAFANVDTKCLVAGIQFANKIMENAVILLSNVAKLFTSDMVSHYLAAIMKGYEYAKESGQQQQPQVPQDLKQPMMTMVSTLTTLLMNLLTNVLSTSMIKTPVPTVQPMKSVKIE